MKSYFYKSAVILLLVLPLAVLQAGGKKPAVLSLEAKGIYAEYVNLINKIADPPAGLATLMEKSGVDLAAVQNLVLRLQQPGAQEQEWAPWQQEFLLLQRQNNEYMIAAYQSLRSQTEALSDAHEKTYLQCLIDYALWNAVPPDSDTIKQAIVDLRSRLKPVIIENKYQLSDLYRLYAEVLSRLMAFIPAELMSLAADSKRFAEQATKLDQNNGAAYLVLGSWYAYAPKIGGGDARYALKLFKRARDLGINNADLALSWSMSAIAYDRLKQPDMARQAIEQALGIQPYFPLALDYRRKIDNNQPLVELYLE